MKQIFVFSEQMPCGRELADLLSAGPKLDALGWETDLDRAIQRIGELRPPAVIVIGQDAMTDCGPAVSRIQTECPGIQIAEVNLETRAIRIYGGEDLIFQELKDLLSAVERCSTAGGKENRTR